jgi:hypothetical protein
MKRISMLLALSLFVPGLCQAYHYYGGYYNDCAVRYSPYAFSYNSTGLIPGGVTYSPYALDSSSSGLVFEGARYTPYAFNYNHSGLVLDYCFSPFPALPQQIVVASSSHPRQTRRTETPPIRTAIVNSRFSRAEEPRRDGGADSMQTVRQYLAARGFKSIETNYLWRVEGKAISGSLIIRDKGIAIRYTDPQSMESLTSGSWKITAEQQERTWEAFAKDFKAGGGSVYSVNATNRDQIIAALDACRALRPQDSTATETVLVARK